MPKLNPLHIFNQVISSGGETGGRGSGVRGRQRKGPGAMAEENMRLSLPHRLAQSTAISHLSFYFFLFPCGSGRNKLGRRSRGESLTVLAFIFQQTGNENDTILGSTLCYSPSVLWCIIELPN